MSEDAAHIRSGQVDHHARRRLPRRYLVPCHAICWNKKWHRMQKLLIDGNACMRWRRLASTDPTAILPIKKPLFIMTPRLACNRLYGSGTDHFVRLPNLALTSRSPSIPFWMDILSLLLKFRVQICSYTCSTLQIADWKDSQKMLIKNNFVYRPVVVESIGVTFRSGGDKSGGKPAPTRPLVKRRRGALHRAATARKRVDPGPCGSHLKYTYPRFI